MKATTHQKSAPMPYRVTVAGCAPIKVRNAWIAEIIRKKLARQHGTFNVTIEERKR